MEFTATGIGMELLEGAAKPRYELANRVKRALGEAPVHVSIEGLREVHTVWTCPPRKKVPPAGLLGLRYSAATQRATCRLMMSPEVSSEDPAWPAYRVAYVQQAADLLRTLFERLEERLGREKDAADVGPASRAVLQALRSLAEEYSAEAGTTCPPWAEGAALLRSPERALGVSRRSTTKATGRAGRSVSRRRQPGG